jgi:predicted O-linked N-acetylglucosamine transferase (SPINDLY family)
MSYIYLKRTSAKKLVENFSDSIINEDGVCPSKLIFIEKNKNN